MRAARWCSSTVPTRAPACARCWRMRASSRSRRFATRPVSSARRGARCLERAAMNDDQLLRYSRQIMLPQIDAEGQLRLAGARVLVIGLGGLGSAASMYLCAGGVGHLTLVDFDRVDLSNLQRQILHATADVGRPKTESAAETLRALNPEVELELIGHALEGQELLDAVARADVVVDA